MQSAGPGTAPEATTVTPPFRGPYASINATSPPTGSYFNYLNRQRRAWADTRAWATGALPAHSIGPGLFPRSVTSLLNGSHPAATSHLLRPAPWVLNRTSVPNMWPKPYMHQQYRRVGSLVGAVPGWLCFFSHHRAVDAPCALGHIALANRYKGPRCSQRGM